MTSAILTEYPDHIQNPRLVCKCLLVSNKVFIRGGVESNRTNFELIFIEFFEYFLPFRINRIANFRIESNEFRTNSNLTPPLGIVVKKLNFKI